MYAAQDLWRLLSPAPARFQDGTIDFIGIAQLQYGFDLVDKLGGMKVGAGAISYS